MEKYKFPAKRDDDDDTQHCVLITAHDESDSAKRDGATQKVKNDIVYSVLGSVMLPVPNSLGDEQNHKWSEYDLFSDLELYGQAAGGILGALPGKAGQLGRGGAGMLSGGVSAMRTTNQIAARASGVTIDPAQNMEYGGENMRTFQFSWSFVPRSKDDAEQLMGIIKFFRVYGTGKRMNGEKRGASNSVSEELTALKAISSAFILQPAVFKIKFNNDKFNTLLGVGNTPYYFVLQSFSTNLFENGYAVSFKDGMPKQINITATFQEKHVMYSDDWNEL